MSSYAIAVPATTANLGPGYDCLGAALTLFNKFEIALSDEFRITASGAAADKIAKNKTNLVYQSLEQFYERIGKPKPVISLHVDLQVPLARGLGSSATAIVAGIVGGNLLAGSPLSQPELLQLAIDMEGHPDNVTPAMVGGCQLIASAKCGGWEFCALPWHKDIAIALAIPDFELSTAKARQVVPKEVALKDAIFNASHLALLVQALTSGNSAWLQSALQDKLHQPYRQSLIPSMEAVQAAAIAAGAHGVVISGAGPTLLALGSAGQIEAIAESMVKAWRRSGVTATKKCLSIAKQGTTYTSL
jgi:homoserine kinase